MGTRLAGLLVLERLEGQGHLRLSRKASLVQAVAAKTLPAAFEARLTSSCWFGVGTPHSKAPPRPIKVCLQHICAQCSRPEVELVHQKE